MKKLLLVLVLLLVVGCSVQEEVGKKVVYLDTDVGEIAVKLDFPDEARYSDGAPVVVVVSTFMTTDSGFANYDVVDDFLEITYLWPGVSKGEYSSTGDFDYGGENCQKALSEVIKFASGDKKDVEGNYVSDYYDVVDNVGVYAFSHPGIIAVNTMAKYDLDVDWFVGRENPTNDEIFAVELGHVSLGVNPYYVYPEDYDSYDLGTDYTYVNYEYDLERVYFDANENEVYDQGEFMLADFGPSAWNKRYYSLDLLEVLEEKLDEWPSEIATYEEAEKLWPLRTCVQNYESLPSDLKVMLVFAIIEHVQPQEDRPSIHQAYDGYVRNGNWIRLNPDSAYLEYSPDLDANSVGDWADAKDWGYVNSEGGNIDAPASAVHEMADREYYGNWDDQLDSVLNS